MNCTVKLYYDFLELNTVELFSLCWSEETLHKPQETGKYKIFF